VITEPQFWSELRPEYTIFSPAGTGPEVDILNKTHPISAKSENCPFSQEPDNSFNYISIISDRILVRLLPWFYYLA